MINTQLMLKMCNQIVVRRCRGGKLPKGFRRSTALELIKLLTDLFKLWVVPTGD